MSALVWIGAVLALASVAGLGLCVLRALRLRGAEMDDDRLRAEMRRLYLLNTGALGLAVVGLSLMVAGAIL